MQVKRDAGKGGIIKSWDSRLEGFMTRGIHERGDTGQEGC